MQSDPHNYQYTFYSSHASTNKDVREPTHATSWEEQLNNKGSSKGHFTTMFTSTVHSRLVEPPPTAYIEPQPKQNKYEPFSNKYGKGEAQRQQSKPISFPYKNPGCGISMSGKSGFEIKGEYVNIKVGKVTNTREGGQSGTLQFHLVRMTYFYDGGQAITPEQYTSVCTSQLGELKGGWSFNDIVRGGMKRDDDSKEYSFRKCYVLLLEEFSEGRYKIVDYMNFD